ncbi:MAG: hypothetical protein L6Q37_16820 [Bdellovibrionaceae bacterium]|nr:hypothetical protein [Pseudobdellovibrionaceae bacterium]
MKVKFLFLSLISITLLINQAYASDCNAEAEAKDFYATNNARTKYKVNFKVRLDEPCPRFCNGHIEYNVHFINKFGDSGSASGISSYVLRDGETSKDVTDELYVSSVSADVKGVEVRSITCR